MTLPEILLLGFFPLLIIYLIKKLLFRYYVIWIQDKPFTDIDGKDYKNKPKFRYWETYEISKDHFNGSCNVWTIRYKEDGRDVSTGQFFVWKYVKKHRAEIHHLLIEDDDKKNNFYVIRRLNFIGEKQAVSEALGRYENL